MEAEEDEEQSLDSGVTMARDSVLTDAGQAEALMPSQNSDVIITHNNPGSIQDDDPDVLVGNDALANAPATSPQRRAMQWAVDLQMKTNRPASCKLCAVPFRADELRVSTWAGRNYGRWCCIGCLAGTMPDGAELKTHGRATEEHVAAARIALFQPQPEVQSIPNVEPAQEGVPAMHAAWEHHQLPNKAWWKELSWGEVLRIGGSTFIQVLDRLRGAHMEAQRKVLDVLEAARQTDDSENEWKCFLVFQFMLLARPRGEETCAELLEERLAWLWGGQWDALWATLRNCRVLPPTGTKASTDKQRAMRRKLNLNHRF